ncbi:DNA cytosine methyltransferase [Oceanibaculum nanhaiense]|uniref:DNA cytosine methyltransferase n=1 Tax=Oceanibaculum nanhaiense TaxID=1909734 RepID=UPI003D2D011F
MITSHEILHWHMFCGLGGGKKGFNKANPRVGNMEGRMRCIGGIDVDPDAIADFNRMGQGQGTVLDLFDRAQYTAFHGHEPPAGWREATPEDIRRAAGGERPHIVFLSAPCKGFSGLLSQKRSTTAKYQALNGLTLRGIWLMLEAWKDDPVDLIVFENVPRIATRGRHLLDRIGALLRHAGYAVAETTHDCGEIGNLGQSRKRFLLVARHMEKVPPFLYEPPQRGLRSVGEIIGRFPLPGDPAAGPMHRIPQLQWKTWVRLAFVEAGKDWRSLQRLRVQDGMLADYGIAPEVDWHGGVMGVQGWGETAATVSGRGSPTTGAYSIADPRMPHSALRQNGIYRVVAFNQAAQAVTGAAHVAGAAMSVADPRATERADYKQNKYRVTGMDEPAGAVIAASTTGNGAFAVADVRYDWSPAAHRNKMKVVRHEDPCFTVTGSDRVGSGALSVADPRFDSKDYDAGQYGVRRWDEPTGTVIGLKSPGQGGFSVADPRPAGWGDSRKHFDGGGHYGVIPWDGSSGAVASASGIDNGRWSVADPRDATGEMPVALPDPAQRLVAVIRALDGTWHRPFTTLDLAALQSLVCPEEHLEMEGLSDSAWRERIGNAVPPDAAEAIATVMGRTLLLAWSGQSFMLSAEPIWVRPIATALAVQSHNPEGDAR